MPPYYELSDQDARDSLRAYVEVYLREEIQLEGLVRNIGGYTRFLDIAGSYRGEIINHSSLAKEAGLPIKTVQSYFDVLEDTLIAIRLPAWTKSPLKRLVAHPKAYLFDNGITNALTHRLSSPLEPMIRGRLFEQFLIQETRRRIDYSGCAARTYYWRTNNGAEVDLVIEFNGDLVLAIEMKSRSSISGADLSGFRSFREDYPDIPCIVACTAPRSFMIDFAEILPWRDYLDRLEGLLGDAP